jgi:hypothetical protein
VLHVLGEVYRRHAARAELAGDSVPAGEGFLQAVAGLGNLTAILPAENAAG